MPNVRFHPATTDLFLAKLEQVQKESQLAAMSPALRSLKNLRLVRLRLIQCFQTASHWDSVVVVSHSTSSQMSCEKLELQFVSVLHFQYFGEVLKLIGATVDELVDFDELRHLLFVGTQALQKWVFLDCVRVLLVIAYLRRFVLALFCCRHFDKVIKLIN